MANETATWGSVTIYAPTKDALEDFIKTGEKTQNFNPGWNQSLKYIFSIL